MTKDTLKAIREWNINATDMRSLFLNILREIPQVSGWSQPRIGLHFQVVLCGRKTRRKKWVNLLHNYDFMILKSTGQKKVFHRKNMVEAKNFLTFLHIFFCLTTHRFFPCSKNHMRRSWHHLFKDFLLSIIYSVCKIFGTLKLDNVVIWYSYFEQDIYLLHKLIFGSYRLIQY